MDHHQFNRWLCLTLRKHYAGIEKHLLSKPDRRLIVAMRVGIADEFLNKVAADPYQSEIIRTYFNGYTMDTPLENILRQIEKRREHYKQQQWFGQEYSQPYIRVGDFVEKKDKHKILKFIVGWYATYQVRAMYARIYRSMVNGESDKQIKTMLHEAVDQVRATQQEPAAEKPKVFSWTFPGNEKTQLRLLYDTLLVSGILGKSASFAQFYALFKGKNAVQKIEWAATPESLVYLFRKLADKFLQIPEGKTSVSDWLTQLLSSGFTVNKGKKLNTKQIETLMKKSLNGKATPVLRPIDLALESMDS